LNKRTSFPVQALCAIALAVGALSAAQAGPKKATLVIVNADPVGVGFNDTTPVAPVGGNPGTTLGEQRLYLYEYIAGKWGRQLPPGPDIKVKATWEALSCTATSATLGSAGAYNVWRDFPNAPVPGTWYSSALANTLSDADLDDGADPEIVSRFNVNLGKTGCLDGSPFYLGVDNIVPTGQVNFAEVLLHELGHGLGFQALTSGLSGARIGDENGISYPAMWEQFMYDNTAGKSWLDMSDAERVTSGKNARNLVWVGRNVVEAAPSVLQKGTPLLQIKSKAVPEVAGSYLVGAASFGPQLSRDAVKGDLAQVIDQADGKTGLACVALSEANAAAVAGKIALVDRGTCAFTLKVKNAQDAGAIGVLVADNAVGSPPPGLGGADATIMIPAVRIMQSDGIKIKAGLIAAAGKSLHIKLGVDRSVRAGADADGRPMLYTPNPYQSGSSVSHWDTSASPNQLMEPAINADLTQKVTPPTDLTLPLLRDIGWAPRVKEPVPQ
jgi:hypothetical protein